MSRADELAVTMCVVDLVGVKEDATETELSKLNARIGDALGVELRDYTRSVDAALTLIPDGWSAEITWQDTPKQSSVALFTPHPEHSEKMDRLGSHVFVQGARMYFPLPIAVCLAALNVHSLLRKRVKPTPNVKG